MTRFTAAADSSGILTHTEVAHRALLSYDSDQFGAGTVRSVLVRRQAAFQAGAAFPDSFYNPLCGEQYRDVSEDMHWEEGGRARRSPTLCSSLFTVGEDHKVNMSFVGSGP